jgi:hypothetical protein
MPKFTLIGEHTDIYGKPNGTKVNYEFHCDFLPEVLEHVDMFLKGCGFNPTGTLDYIPDEEYYGAPTEWEPEEEWNDHGGGSTMADYPELYDEQDIASTKSKHYFDTERNK